MYLAGYGVECILKAMILASLPAKAQEVVSASFRGSRAHDFDWLKEQYYGYGGPPFPREVARIFGLVNSWTTKIRYLPGNIRRRDAAAFLDAVAKILEWAEGRL